MNGDVDAEAEALVLVWAESALAELAVNFARQTVPRVGGFVVLPLGWEEAPLDLTRAVPDLSSVLNEPTVYAPGIQVPGIYLVQPWLVGHSADGEEYVHTLQSDQLSNSYVSYYRLHRRLDRPAALVRLAS